MIEGPETLKDILVLSELLELHLDLLRLFFILKLVF